MPACGRECIGGEVGVLTFRLLDAKEVGLVDSKPGEDYVEAAADGVGVEGSDLEHKGTYSPRKHKAASHRLHGLY